jgi:amidase
MSERTDAFVERLRIEPYASGPLDGLTFAVKDLIDVAGRVTGCGNPRWAETHPPAVRHAVAVDLLLASGATLVGKTVSDELAFSIVGENAHWGTPLNPRAPDRVAGGSSSGSASAVAQGECDFAIGTDTTGSVRVPAANCGLFGMRPSHDRVSLAGVMPFAPSFDTVGVLARDAGTLRAAMGVLAGLAVEGGAPRGLPAAASKAVASVALPREAWDLCEPDVVRVCRGWLASRGIAGPELSLTELAGDEGARADVWLATHCQLQWAEIDASLGAWVASARPTFGPLIAANFALLEEIDRPGLPARVRLRERLAERLGEWLAGSASAHRAAGAVGPCRVLCFPTTAAPAPRKGSLFGDRRADAYMAPTLALQTLASVARLPQVTVPAGDVGGAPVGISFASAPGTDAELLAWVAERAS